MLLYVVTSPTSWEALRTFNGVTHPTFKAACAARGLLEGDEEWDICLTEAALMQGPPASPAFRYHLPRV
jgi:hypothetical protein